jgi:hypothetical protein
MTVSEVLIKKVIDDMEHYKWQNPEAINVLIKAYREQCKATLRLEEIIHDSTKTS